MHHHVISTIKAIADRTIPKTRPFNKVSVPWWNKPCYIAVCSKKHAFDRMMRTCDSQDIIYKRTRADTKKAIKNGPSVCRQSY